MWCSARSPGNGSSRGPRKLTASASEFVGISQLRPDIPQLWIKPFAERRPQVLRARASAGPGLAADLTLHHQDVARAPVRKGLVVVEESLTKVEEVAMPLPVTKDLQQRGRASPLDQGAKRVVHAGLVEPLAQAGHLFRRGVQARHVLRLLQAREKLYLAELDRLKTAGGRELGAEGEKVLRRHRLEDVD